MKIPKYSCSVCRKPSSRKWNLNRHIINCHAGIGMACVSNWDFPEDTYRPHWNRWEKGAINQKENSHYIQQDLLKQSLSSNESNDRKPFDSLHLFTEAGVKALAEKIAPSLIQPTQSRISSPFSPMSSMQSPMGNYNTDPAANLQIFGFRGHVCDKCLMPVMHYVAFPDAGDGRIERYNSHYCMPAKAAATTESVDRSGTFRFLRDKILTLLKQKMNSRNGNNNHLVALRLSSPHEETIKLPNPVDPS